MSISVQTTVCQKRSESVDLSTCKKSRKEIEDEVESTFQPLEEVTGTEKFSVENIEVPKDSIHVLKGNITQSVRENSYSF